MMLESPVRGKRARRVWRGLVRKRSSNATFAGWLPYPDPLYFKKNRTRPLDHLGFYSAELGHRLFG